VERHSRLRDDCEAICPECGKLLDQDGPRFRTLTHVKPVPVSSERNLILGNGTGHVTIRFIIDQVTAADAGDGDEAGAAVKLADRRRDLKGHLGPRCGWAMRRPQNPAARTGARRGEP
jgi:hypothetical protein